MKITTKSGFECNIDKNILDDRGFLRLYSALIKEPEDPFDLFDQMEEKLLGAKGAAALTKHIIKVYGYESVKATSEELAEIIAGLNPSKN